MSKQMMAIDFGSSEIKIVVGHATKEGKVKVREVHQVKTPEEAIMDGKIMDFAMVKNCLSEVLKGIRGVRECVCTIQSTETITREMVLPLLKSQDMDQMIQMEVYQSFPIELESYVVEHQITSEFMEDNIKKATVLTAALPKKIVESYLQLLGALKLKPIAMDIHSNAVSKLFSQKDENIVNEDHQTQGKTIALMDMGNSQIHIHVISDGALQFSRIILRELISDDEYLFAEISRYFQFYTSRKTGNRIDVIYLYGGNIQNNALETQMAEAVNILTFRIEKMSHVEIDEQTAIGPYLNAIGALIRQ